MGMVKLRPLTESNILNRLYDKTLHTWLSPRDEHVIQNLWQSAVRERLAKYVKYKAFLFYFYFYFSPDSPTEVTRAWNFTRDDSKHALWRKEVPFGVQTMADNILGFKFPKNRQNWASILPAERFSCASMRIDVREEWRHWRVAA